MTHEHHHHEHTVTSLNKAFILGIALNVAFVVVEFAVGLSYGSMGLLSDAGHNLSDVASLLLAMLAFRLAQAPGYAPLHLWLQEKHGADLAVELGDPADRRGGHRRREHRPHAASRAGRRRRPSPGRRASGWRSTASRRGCF